MTGTETSRPAGGGGAIARVLVCALLSLAILPTGSRAATILYDFTSPPDDLNRYSAPGGLVATFEGLQQDGSSIFPDHTNGTAGSIFGAGDGPSFITFSAPVDLVELFVNNSTGDVDNRPVEFKLFGVTASLGGTPVFSYDRAAESAPGAGFAPDFLRIAPASPVTIDTISFSNFNSDTLDDLKVNFVPEPAQALAGLAGVLALAAGGRRRRGRVRGKSRRGGHAPERDPPRTDSGGQYITDTQAGGLACAATEIISRPVPGATATGGACT